MTQSKCRINIICAAVFMAASAFVGLYAIPKEITLNTLWGGAATGVTSRTFPYFAVSIIFIASLAQLVFNIVAYRKLLLKQGRQPQDKVDWTSEIRALLVFICCVLYMLLFPVAGFLVSTFISSTLVLIVLRDFNWRHYLSVCVVGGLIYLVFQFLLGINLP